jgi:hypothetical protein
MASTTWVAPDNGRLEVCGLGVDGAGNQALRHQRLMALNSDWSRRYRLVHPGGEPVDVASPCARMAASNFSSSTRTVHRRQVIKEKRS